MEIKELHNILNLTKINFDKIYEKLKEVIKFIKLKEINEILGLNLKLDDVDAFSLIKKIKELFNDKKSFKKKLIIFLLNNIILKTFDFDYIIANIFIYFYNNYIIKNNKNKINFSELKIILKDTNEFINLKFYNNNIDFLKNYNEFFTKFNNYWFIKNKLFIYNRYFIFKYQNNYLSLGDLLKIFNLIKKCDTNLDWIKTDKNINYENYIKQILNFKSDLYDFIMTEISFENIFIESIIDIFHVIMKKFEIKFFIKNNEALCESILHNNYVKDLVYKFYIKYLLINLEVHNLNKIKFDFNLFILLLIFIFDNNLMTIGSNNNKNDELAIEINNNINFYNKKIKNIENKNEIWIINNIICSLKNELLNLNNINKIENEENNLTDNNINIGTNKSLLTIYYFYCKKQNLKKESFNDFDNFKIWHKNLKLNGIMLFVKDFNIKNLNNKKLSNNDVLLILKKMKTENNIFDFDCFKCFINLIFKLLYDTEDNILLNKYIYKDLNWKNDSYFQKFKLNDCISKSNLIDNKLLNNNSVLNFEKSNKLLFDNKSIDFNNKDILNSLRKIKNSFDYEKQSVKMSNYNTFKPKKLKYNLSNILPTKIATKDFKTSKIKLNKEKLKLLFLSQKNQKIKSTNLRSIKQSYLKIEKFKNIKKYKNLNNLNWNTLEKLKLSEYKNISENPEEVLDKLINKNKISNDILNNNNLIQLKIREKDLKSKKKLKDFNILKNYNKILK